MLDSEESEAKFIDTEKLITETGDSFRDRVSNIDKKGKRVWIYPKKPKGTFHVWRVVTAIILLAVMVGLPFIKINGNPFILFDVINRKFVVFGMVFWPQDFHILALAFLALMVFIILFTAVFGRIWCGWACPQTIFMEMVFRKIEYWIEGDASEQRKLNNRPWNAGKIFKKGLKQTIFFGLSFLIGNIFLAYFIGYDMLWKIITAPPSEHIAGLTVMLIFTFLFWGVFAWFREQACIYVCPYGRLQSALIDRNSIVITYDHVRGEPRNKKVKAQETQNAGDCIDCSACVKVCPTGIDIRNGTQLECVNCTACIDACDEIMEKIDRPKKLIKYATENQIAENRKFMITPRIILYSIFLALLVTLVAVMIIGRTDVDTNVLRAKGALYQELENGDIQNLYTLKVVNKTAKVLPLEMKLMNIKGKIKLVASDEIIVPASKLVSTAFFIQIPPGNINTNSTKLKIGIFEGVRKIDEVETVFTAPVRRKK